MRRILEFIPHLTLVLALGLAVFAVLDGFNPMMEWLTSGISKAYIFVLCGMSVLTSVLLIVGQVRGK